MANEIEEKKVICIELFGPCEDHAQYAYKGAILNTGSQIYAELKYEQAKSEYEEAIKNVKAVFDSIIR